MIDLDAAEKLANAATQPGPWVSVVQDGNATVVDAHGMWVADCGAAPADAAFIAASRQLVPALIAEVRQLRAKLADAHEQLDACCERCLDKCPHAPTEQP